MEQDGAGWSESLYAVLDTSMTWQQMMAKMKALLPYRALLSITQEAKCLNLVKCKQIRVEDTEVNKDSLKSFVDTPTGFAVPAGANTIFYQNREVDCAAKVKWSGVTRGQMVYQFIHGIPVYACEDTPEDVINIIFKTSAPMSSIWLTLLRSYAHQIRLQGLGFRFLDSPWDVNGAPGPNAIPTNVTYDVVKQQYVFTMPLPAIKPRMRYVLRGFKALNFLNGRYAGQAGAGNTITIQKKARQVTWDGQGTLVPEVWGYFMPNETTPADPAQLPGVSFEYLGEKKVGRPFNLQVGRAKVKPT